MLNLTQAVRQLKKERAQTRRRLEQLDTALQALSGVGGPSGQNRGTVRSHALSGRRRTMSAAARKTDCRRSACALGQMESGSKKEITRYRVTFRSPSFSGKPNRWMA